MSSDDTDQNSPSTEGQPTNHFSNLVNAIVLLELDDCFGTSNIRYEIRRILDKLGSTPEFWESVLTRIMNAGYSLVLESFKCEYKGRVTLVFDSFVLRTVDRKSASLEYSLFRDLVYTHHSNMEKVVGIINQSNSNNSFVITQKETPLTKDVLLEHKNKIKSDILNALNYMNRNNIVHRDIAMDNIIYSIDQEGLYIFKLIDYNIISQRRWGVNNVFRESVKFISN